MPTHVVSAATAGRAPHGIAASARGFEGDPFFERTIAVSRLVLASLGLATTVVELGDGLGGSTALARFFLIYTAFSAVSVGLAWTWVVSTRAFTVGSHAVDVVAATVPVFFPAAPQSQTFSLLLLPLAVSAFRWGIKRTLWTVSTVLVLFAVEAAALEGVGTGLSFATGLMRPVLRMASFVVVGLLIGVLADALNDREVEATWFSHMLREARAGYPLDHTYHQVLASAVGLFGGRRALLVLHDQRTGRTFTRRFDARPQAGTPEERIRELSAADVGTYVFDLPPVAVHGVFVGENVVHAVFARRDDGSRYQQTIDVPVAFARAFACRRFVVGVVEFDARWLGRIFVFDLPWTRERGGWADRTQRMVERVGPAVYDRFVLRRLRSRATASERSRIMRELHDGPMQAVLGVQMGLAALARKARETASPLAPDVADLHDLVKGEAAQLREAFDGLRARADTASSLGEALQGVVTRFGAYSSLDVTFVGCQTHPTLSARVRRELPRVLHECLVNVRRHARATRVSVMVRVMDDGWLTLSVEDNGQGFPFEGTRTSRELRESGDGPWSILERLRSFDGELIITSAPGKGARLDIAVPIAVPLSV